MALFIMSFMGLMPVSALLFGTLGEYIGPSTAVLVGAVVLIAWAAMLALRPALQVLDLGLRACRSRTAGKPKANRRL